MSSRPTQHAAAPEPASRAEGERHTRATVTGPTSVVAHRVGFHQTDAMGIMHHANYLHLLENARVRWLEEHHRPYTDYIARDLHYAVTAVEIQYVRSARFDDRIDTQVSLEWVRGASLAIAYELRCRGEVIARARTCHALVDPTGRPKRIPHEDRRQLEQLLGAAARDADDPAAPAEARSADARSVGDGSVGDGSVGDRSAGPRTAGPQSESSARVAPRATS